MVKVAEKTAMSPKKETILGRILDANQKKMNASLAKYVLTLGFSGEDQDRMSELAERNQRSELDRDEKLELDDYVRTGLFLTMLQSRARKALRAK